MGHIRVFRHYFHIPFLLLGLVEGFILFTAVYLGAYIRFLFSLDQVNDFFLELWPQSVLFAMVMLTCMTAMSVYPSYSREGMTGVMLRTAVSFFIGSTVLAVIFYTFPQLALGRGILFLAALMAFIFLLINRLLLSRLLSKDRLKARILVLGAGQKAQSVWEKHLEIRSELSYVIVGFVPIVDEPICIDTELLIYAEHESLHSLALRLKVDEVLVSPDDRRHNFPIQQLLDCKLSGIKIMDIMNFFERESAKIEVDWLSPSWLVFSDGFSSSDVSLLCARAFDVIVSLMILAFFWPIIAMTTMAIMFEDGVKTNIFYRQIRIGFNQKPFSIYKFRSMRENAEQHGAQWAKEQDDRITKVGRFIRKYRIDELPQLLNVLKGDMAIVGPRPERPEFCQSLTQVIPFFNERHRVKPGITGWAQLCFPYGASVEDSKMKLKYDLYYVKNHSFLLDMLIILQTIEVILFGKGAR